MERTDLDSVEACLDGVEGCLAVESDVTLDVVDRERLGDNFGVLNGRFDQERNTAESVEKGSP